MMRIPSGLLEPYIPINGVNTLIKRNLAHPKKNKWELRGYEINREIKNPNFFLVYRILPDNFIPDEQLKMVKNEREKPEDFKKALGSNKFAWLKTITAYEPPKNSIPPVCVPLGFEKQELKAQTTQPLIIGLGEASPYETGITLDFLTGLPIIPGSAVKGITRRAAILFIGASHWNEFSKQFQDKFKFEPKIIKQKSQGGSGNIDEKANKGDSKYLDLLPYGEEFDLVAQKIEKEVEPDEFIRIFGTQDQKGKVIFMDAYPIDWSEAPKGELFRVDIMNPHYSPYYKSEGKEPPADWYNPVPVPYLTVNKGVKYRFVLASKEQDSLKKAKEWLGFALENIGVGAKGNQGYGVFEVW